MRHNVSNTQRLPYFRRWIDDDINGQQRTLHVEGNIILWKCNICFLEVKLITLCRTYCSPRYGIQLWWDYKKSTLNSLHIAYHNILKLFMDTLKYESTRLLCTLFDVQCCQSVIGNMVHRFMCRLDTCFNHILNNILTSIIMFNSRIRTHQNKFLYVNSWQWTLNYVVCQMSTHGPRSQVY